MPNHARTPDQSKLDNNYQILTELHAEDGSRTYLARHLKLNRDVTITVTWLVGDDTNALTHFAADAHLLSAMRHPNIVPVLEGIWLDDRTFAIVRARVRGQTVEQLILGAGPVPIERVSTTIQQVDSAITWARSSGVVHRNVTPRSIVFQQGNGRVLLSLEPRPLAADAMPGECDDARTIGRIASEMLLGQLDDDPERTAMVVPHMVPAVVQALEAVRLCERTSAPTAVASLIAALSSPDALPREEVVTSVEPVVVVDAPKAVVHPTVVDLPPIADRVVFPHSRPRRGMSGAGPAVVEAPQSFSYNARLGSTVAVLAILGVASTLLIRHKESAGVYASQAASDTTQQAAGDVALSRPRPDSSAPVVTVPAPPPARTQQPSVIIPSDPARRPITTSDTIKRAPQKAVTPPPLTLPRDSATTPVRDTTSTTPAVEACASPESEDQRKCLLSAINRNDRELQVVYGKLIAALRRQAGAGDGDPDPDTVDELRVAQRKWLEERDAACREVGERPLYARERSSCFAQQSANRARELQRKLEGVPPT
jgi:uncharacterized protein YecT (DUF1311 family)